MKKGKISRVIIYFLVLSLLNISSLPVSAAASTQTYENVITEYYEFINFGIHSDITNLYGAGLKSFVSDFFKDKKNIEAHNGIYNVQNVELLTIKKISQEPFLYYDGISTYSNTETFFIKCKMKVYSSDKYYTEGNNYFLFNIGISPNGEVKIANIQIPTYNIIEHNDSQISDVISYKQTRNYYLYGDVPSPFLTDKPAYIDYVKNPSSIRVLYNGSVKSINFKDYCLTVAANEINTLTSTDGLRAGAMAVKMFAMHFIHTAASGSNYDINSTAQKYDENTKISSGAKSAMNYVMDYFLLDSFGANFKTFYRTSESNHSYCKKNGGIFAQTEGDSMGAKGTSWQDILKHYYTRVSNVSYYNSDMNYGSLIITTQHVHDWGYGTTCAYCGAIAK